MQYLFSVVIPVFNSAKFLPDAINSVLNQKRHNVEIILVNDCSTDSSGEICESYLQILQLRSNAFTCWKTIYTYLDYYNMIVTTNTYLSKNFSPHPPACTGRWRVFRITGSIGQRTLRKNWRPPRKKCFRQPVIDSLQQYPTTCKNDSIPLSKPAASSTADA